MNWVDRRRPAPGRTELLRRKEVAEMLGVTPNTVSRWAREGRLPSIQTLGGHRRFEAHLIRQLLRREAGTPLSPAAPDEDEES